MESSSADRRRFLQSLVAGGAAIWTASGCERTRQTAEPLTTPPGTEREAPATQQAGSRPDYSGPNVILVRFGGGVRRRETIDPQHTFSPYLCHELARQGTWFPNMVIDRFEGVQTSHGEGTLHILTGKYDQYEDVGQRLLRARFEAKVPTLFEYLRKAYRIAEHQTLIVNGEDRTDEEFYAFSNHHLFGANYRCNTLSLYRFKRYLLRREVESWQGPEEPLQKKRAELARLEALDHRQTNGGPATPEMQDFWESWRQHYGGSGLRNPRGDALLTELTLWALARLRPRLLMVNYNDCDYVHWGNLTHYTRGISIMDQGLRRIVEAIGRDPEYRDNTVLAVVPDCGRDTNRLMSVPCQHHFGTRSAFEIFALLVGPGIARGVVVDRLVQQIDLAPTVGQQMGFQARYAEGRVLEEALL